MCTYEVTFRNEKALKCKTLGAYHVYDAYNMWISSVMHHITEVCLGGSLGGSSTPLAPRPNFQKYLTVLYFLA